MPVISAPPRAGKPSRLALLLPSPPDSPPDSPKRPTPPPTDGFTQQALKGQVREWVPPDHSWGEKFPGKQSPTLQLSLFEAGVKRKRTSSVSTREA